MNDAKPKTKAPHVEYRDLPVEHRKRIEQTPEWQRYAMLKKALHAARGPHGTPYPQREHDEARRAWEALEQTAAFRAAVSADKAADTSKK
jgi:hypothetical protein